MRKRFAASLCKNGLLGGALYVDSVSVTYRTGKLTVPDKFRNLVMPYAEIESVINSRWLGLPTITIQLKNREEYQFLVFGRKAFIAALRNSD